MSPKRPERARPNKSKLIKGPVVDEIWPETLHASKIRYPVNQNARQPLPIMQHKRSRTNPNPWKLGVLQNLRKSIRFVLWVGIAVNGAMVCIFSILFTYEFLHHLWDFLFRTWFSEDW